MMFVKESLINLTVKKALITGITGQDGSYLARFLLDKGYEVHGLRRRASSFNTDRIDNLHNYSLPPDHRLQLHYGDMTDSTSLIRILQMVQPDEIYNLAAQSHVKVSFDTPEYTANSDAVGTLRLLEAIRILGMESKVRFYQASTSELYGKVQETPQNENTPFYPRSPYAAAKIYAYWITINYREAYGIYACNGILFNHESPVRGETFVTRKITRAAARIKHGLQEKLSMGNLDSKRDWGYAGDYAEAMWLMLQQQEPEDFVIATGETHTVREFLELSFQAVGITIQWQGEGVNEVGVDAESGKVIVDIDPQYFRPTEVDLLLGDPTKAKQRLGWQPRTTFRSLIEMMMDADHKKAELELMQKQQGIQTFERFE